MRHLLFSSSEALIEKPDTNIDYDSFPVADLNADLPWIFLPASRGDPIYRKMHASKSASPPCP